MDREINLDSIRALEQQIQEHERAIIRLKRARNSLLNVSTRLPPEVLGSIFRWNVIPDGDFGGLSMVLYNFLLVCHHWFQVASATPGLWSFWGNSVEDWTRRHARCRTAPLDLVLAAGYTSCDLDDTLRDALRDRAARDTIRRVHLKGINTRGLLNPIISSIIVEGEESRSISVESFILRNGGEPSVDISGFLSRYQFPKLYRLELSRCSISSWDLLKSRITSLTTLSLAATEPSPLPTLSQMLSILSANPNLQCLLLFHGSVPHAGSDRSSSQVQLRHLKRLRLASNLRCAFGLLNRLELPDKMDDLKLTLSGCSPPDLPQTLGPYLRNRVRRRSPDGLKLSIDPGRDFFSILIGDACEGDLTKEGWFVMVEGTMNVALGEEEADKLCLDIVAHLPQEKVVDLITVLPILRSEGLCAQMCNLTRLHLECVDLSTWFVEPNTREPHVSKDVLRGLRSILITDPTLTGSDWSPLTDFLTRRAAIGNRISFLHLDCYPRMSEDVFESIRQAVDVFEEWESYEDSDDGY
jgi:hypothetical protein